MPRTCAIEKCKRKSRSICSCCNKNLCHDHLKEHEDLNNPQLNPLMNEFNSLDEQLKSSNTEKLIGGCRQKLVQWRDNCCKLINQLYEQKLHELDQRSLQKLDEQRTQLNLIRSKMTELIRQQETNQGNIDALTLAIRHIHDDIKNIENTRLQIDIRPLNIDDSFIFIQDFEPNKCNLVSLTTPYRTIDCSGEWGPALVSNNRYLLIDRHPNLCLINQQLQIVKQSPWKFDFIRDMCWSTALNTFIVITRSREIYIVNEKTLATELIQPIDEQDWSSCTCSDTSLYLTARREGTNIFELNLLSAFELIKRWKPPHSCKHYEIILNTEYKNKTLALVISHGSTNLVHLELRSSITLDRLWSLELNVSHTIGQPLIRCSALKCDEWLLVDNNTSQLFHVRKDGLIRAVSSCNPAPWNSVLFGSNIIAIRTKNSVHFHKL
ncbi:unnamed protein product [Rotaria socialis]|uniref:Uncharacterized protein n=1 Tax=Rotaria socialis TaxID=392032 RepID=A0A820GH64_9BILA|nr:unnamed protein product [Rotaria socialis]CAF3463594.1 unnamed protein product [Rotaria socialis]CAF3681503.1 unnamed protein product [Rotaria socialis]CAF3728071.1 unnamed protein product [Rotaria socialis]CAF3777691.1 unnamed protein product [Rotaria socialis]